MGWIYNTRRLLISLYDPKIFAWIKTITDLIAQGETTASETETIIGRLNHVGYILPTDRHFLSRLRKLQSAARFKRQIHIPKLVLKELELWETFLHTDNKGISFNLLKYRQPTHVYRSDSCKHGIGGLSALGRAWIWLIPVHLRSRAHINLLELIGNIVCIWVDIIDKATLPESCLLFMGDSTSAMGWIRKSNFKNDDENDTYTIAKLAAAHHLARIVQESLS